MARVKRSQSLSVTSPATAMSEINVPTSPSTIAVSLTSRNVIRNFVSKPAGGMTGSSAGSNRA